MTKEERAAKWDAEFIPCKKHPTKRCNRSSYIKRRERRCAQCKNKNGRLDRYHRYYHSDKGMTRKAWYVERKLHG